MYMKQKFENILSERGIYGEDVEQILFAVHDMFAFMADKTYEEEPYAKEIIKRYNQIAYEVFSLRDVLYQTY